MKFVATLLIASSVMAGCATRSVSADTNCTQVESRQEGMLVVQRCIAWEFGPSMHQRAKFESRTTGESVATIMQRLREEKAAN